MILWQGTYSYPASCYPQQPHGELSSVLPPRLHHFPSVEMFWSRPGARSSSRARRVRGIGRKDKRRIGAGGENDRIGRSTTKSKEGRARNRKKGDTPEGFKRDNYIMIWKHYYFFFFLRVLFSNRFYCEFQERLLPLSFPLWRFTGVDWRRIDVLQNMIHDFMIFCSGSYLIASHLVAGNRLHLWSFFYILSY